MVSIYYKEKFPDKVCELPLSVGIRTNIQNVVRDYTGSLKWWFTSLSLGSWLGFQDHACSPSCWTGLSQEAAGSCQCLCMATVTLGLVIKPIMVPISLLPAKVQEVPQTAAHRVPGSHHGCWWPRWRSWGRFIFDNLTVGLQVLQELPTHAQDKRNHSNSSGGRRKCNSSENSKIPKLDSNKTNFKKPSQELAR